MLSLLAATGVAFCVGYIIAISSTLEARKEGLEARKFLCALAKERAESDPYFKLPKALEEFNV